MEPGTLFPLNGFRIETMQGDSWRTRRPGCLTGLTCTFTGGDAQTLLDSMGDGGALRFTFRDRHGQAQDLSWPLAEYPAAFADLLAQSDSRGLLRQRD